jgi:two-component system chemotaxis response regulator CheY
MLFSGIAIAISMFKERCNGSQLQKQRKENDVAKIILVVDDSAAMRQLVSFAAKGAGYDVMAADGGKDALKKLDGGQQIDMVITDVNMPEMDGIEFIKQLRGMVNYRFTPIVMLTTESQEDKKREGKAAGASGWIVKPFKPEQLIEVIKKFVK